MKEATLELTAVIEPVEEVDLDDSPLPGVPTVGVYYRQYLLWGRSPDPQLDGDTRQGFILVQASRRIIALRPVVEIILPYALLERPLDEISRVDVTRDRVPRYVRPILGG